MQFALAFVSAYLLGSFPTAYLAGRLVKRRDIRQLGGGNMGALNAARELGLAAGLIVFLIDALKGCAAIWIARALDLSVSWVYLSAFLAVAGHCWPLFLKFKGGKGAATAIGVTALLAPLPLACTIPAGLIVIAVTSNVTLTMAVMFVLMPLFLGLFDRPFHLIIFLIALFVFLAARYTGTVRRNLEKRGWRDFLIEKNYTPWQSRRHKTK